MAIDISTLVVTVKSDGIEDTTKGLQGLTVAAEAAEKKSVILKKATDDSSESQKNATSAIEKQLEKLKAQAELLGASNEKMATYKLNSMGANESQITSAGSLGKLIDKYKEKITQQQRDIELYNAETQAAAALQAAQEKLNAAQAKGNSLNLAGERAAQVATIKAETQAYGEMWKEAQRMNVEWERGRAPNVSGQRAMQVTELRATASAMNAAHTEAIKLNKEFDESSNVMRRFGLGTVGAKREVVVLAHEMISGNFSRIPGSILVLGERMSAMESVIAALFSATGIAVMGALAAFGLYITAVVKGSHEQKEMNDALILTGNYAGTSSAGILDMAQKATAAGGSISAAKKAMIELAASGQFTSSQIILVGTAATKMSDSFGIEVDKTIKQFEELTKKPAESILKLNDHYHFLTASVYEQILALEKQGNVQEASRLAVEAYAKAVDDRSKESDANLGTIAKAWRGVKEATQEAIDKALEWGKKATPQTALDTAKARLAAVQGGYAPGVYDAASQKNEEASALKAVADAQNQVNRTALRNIEIGIQKKNVDASLHAMAELEKEDGRGRQESALKIALAKNAEYESAVKLNDLVTGEHSAAVTEEAIAARREETIRKHTKAAKAGDDDRLKNLEDSLVKEKTAFDREKSIYDNRIIMLDTYHNKLGMSDAEFFAGKEAAREEYLRSEKSSYEAELKLIQGFAVNKNNPKEIAERTRKEDALLKQHLLFLDKTHKADVEDAVATEAIRYKKDEDEQKSADKTVEAINKEIEALQLKVNAHSKLASAVTTERIKELEEQSKFLAGAGFEDEAMQRKIKNVEAETEALTRLKAVQQDKEKEATAIEQFDKLYLGLLNTLHGVKTSTEGLGIGAELAEAISATDQYTDSLEKLALAQKAVADAGGIDSKKAEEALAKMINLGEVQRKMWKNVGDDIAKSLGDAFGKGGKAAGSLLQTIIASENTQKKILENKSIALAKLNKDEVGYAERVKEVNLKAADDSMSASIASYGEMASAAKGFFEKGSSGYAALATIEKASHIASLAMNAEKIVSNLATIPAAIAAGASQFFAQSGWFGFIGIAAMIALMASLGYGGGGGISSSDTAASRQKQQGTGTVLGDEGAKSESISKSIEILKNNSNIALTHSSKMLAALQSINDGISGMAAFISQTSGLRGTSADQIGMGIGSSKSFLGFSSESKELTDTGVVFDRIITAADKAANASAMDKYNKDHDTYLSGISDSEDFISRALSGPQAPKQITSSQTIGSALQGNVGAHGYADIHSESSSFWGLFQDSSNSTELKELGSDLKVQFVKTIQSLYNGVLSAAGALGKDSSLWESVLKNVSFEQAGLDRISLKGLSGADVEKELQAAFSKLGDTMAKAVMPELASFQKVGEGMFQTLVRVASGVDSATFQLEKLGIKIIDYSKVTNKQGDVAAELVRDSIMVVEGMSKVGDIMVDLTGSVSDLISSYTALKQIQTQVSAGGLNTSNVSREMLRGAGGLEGLKGGVQNFFDNFLSEADKQASKISVLRREFAGMNIEIPTTRDSFVHLVKSLDDGTTSGNFLVGKLLSLSGAFQEVAATAENLSNIVTKAVQGAQADNLAASDAAFSALTKSVNAKKDILQKAFDAQIKDLKDSSTKASTSLQDITTVFNSLSSALVALQPLTRNAAQDILRAALALSSAGGSLAKYAGLDEALKSVQQPSEQGFSNSTDYQRDRQITANIVSALKDNAGAQVSVAQMTLDAINTSVDVLTKNHEDDISALDKIISDAQAQLDTLHGIDNTLLSINDALNSFLASVAKASSPVTSTDTVSKLYQDILGRKPDAEGGAYWAGQISSGAKSADQVASSLTAAKPINDAVMSAYANLAGKTGDKVDETGLQYWTSRAYSVGVDQMQKEFKSAVDGSHANGLDYVPFDNYRAELHKGERVLTAKQATDYDQLCEEIKQMRNDMNNGLVTVAQNTGKTAKKIDKWDSDGLPAFRDVDANGVATIVNVHVV